MVCAQYCERVLAATIVPSWAYSCRGIHPAGTATVGVSSACRVPWPGVGPRRCRDLQYAKHLHNDDDGPDENADAGGGRGDIFDDTDLVVLGGLDEIAEGLNGGVEHL